MVLARLFLQDAPIWVLDEPTEGLDPDTHTDLIRDLLSAAQDRTLLMITRFTTHLDHFDQIVIMKNGRIQAHGSHGMLLKSSPAPADADSATQINSGKGFNILK